MLFKEQYNKWLSECTKILSKRNQQRKNLLAAVLINKLQKRKRRNDRKKHSWVNPIFMERYNHGFSTQFCLLLFWEKHDSEIIFV